MHSWKMPARGRRLFFGSALLLASAYFVWLVRGVLLPFALALILAYLLHPLVAAAERRGARRPWSILLVYLAVLGLVGGLVAYTLPSLTGEMQSFADDLPRLNKQVQGWLSGLYMAYRRAPVPETVRQVMDANLAAGQQVLLAWVGGAARGIFSLLSAAWGFALAPILAYYLLADWEQMFRGAAGAFPAGWRSEMLRMGREIDRVLMKFIRGHLLVALLVGTASGLGLAFLGVPFPHLLGIVAGITELIPYFGPFLGALPAVALALSQSHLLALYTALLMLVVQQLEANVLSPRILGESVGLHPLLVIFALLSGGELFGIVGMLLAVPVAAIVKIVFSRLLALLASD